MDNSVLGAFSDGFMLSRVLTRSDEVHPEEIWVKGAFMWSSNGFQKSDVQGICGSLIWNNKSEIVGFFQHDTPAIHSNVCYAIAANEFMSR
jgi:hypothetical protein